ncbi:MAG: NAD-dependent epimerase/dehydratase family protein [Candidatus Omnitrophica bacterium]|nr:NAD-dependent epimerase/dehydratase family protein [Candidatus Omnitrophota bacterium]
MNKNIFITGATGFIGRKLALNLVQDDKVSALVRPQSQDKIGKLKEAGVEIIIGDLLNINSYLDKLKDIDYVFHLAALFRLEAPKKELYQYNVLGTRMLLEACVGKGIKRIIYFSTAYIAGNREGESIKEEEPYPKKFKNWYEWSKAEAEKIVWDYRKQYNLPVVIVRPVIVYGPESFYGFYNALKIISEGRLWVYPGDGKNKVHLVHVEDVVGAVIYLAYLENITDSVYHICGDSALTSAELIRFICHEVGVGLPKMHLHRGAIKFASKTLFGKIFFKDISPQLLDYFLYHQSYANDKIKTSGYLFRYSSPLEGIRSVIKWYRKNGYLKNA